MENKIAVSGKQTKVGSSLKNYVTESLSLTLKKYFKDFINANVLFSKDTFNFKCEGAIHLESTIFVKSNSLSNDAYGSFNLANEKIKKRIRRYHRKLTDHRQKNSKLVKNIEASEYVLKDPDKEKAIIAISTCCIKNDKNPKENDAIKPIPAAKPSTPSIKLNPLVITTTTNTVNRVAKKSSIL